MMERGFGFPRFKKTGQYRSFVFPAVQIQSLDGFQIKLPKIGAMPINLHRPIPEGFVVKQVRVISKASGWYAQLILQSDVSVPDVMPHGNSLVLMSDWKSSWLYLTGNW
jgi:putative transposase